MKIVNTPLEENVVLDLKVGDRVYINGMLYTARDLAHKRLVETIKKGKKLPFNLNGEIIYYMGPSPAKPGEVIGSAGPTTSSRMDPYTLPLLDRGLRGMIGKGNRSEEIKEALRNYKAVYFAATGGAGALLSKSIKSVEIIAYQELGPEAIRRLNVANFPAIVANDAYGGDIYKI